MEYQKQFKFCGEGVEIDPGVRIDHPEKMVVGDRVKIRHGVTIMGDFEEIKLDAGVVLYPQVFIQGNGRLILGERVVLYPANYLSISGKESFLEIGGGSHCAPGCALYGAHGLTIGEHCALSAHVVMTTIGHDPRAPELMVKTSRGAGIVMEKNCWVGANATVLAGVRIGEGSVIGAGAVLTKDAAPNGIYFGAPAKRASDRV